jgi:hypothetical protein
MSDEKLRKVIVVVKGFRPYMEHRRPNNDEEVTKASQVTKVLQKNPFDEKAQKNEADLGVYRDAGGKIFIPADHFQESMIRAGANIRVKGQGKKTYKDYMRSYVFVTPDKIPITPQEYEVDTRYVKIQRNGILRNRPIWNEWTASFTLMVTDPSLPMDEIKNILEIAGSRVGIGDYRPRYGLFEITKFEEQ